MDIKEKEELIRLLSKYQEETMEKSKEVGEFSKLSFYRKDEHYCKSWLLSIVRNCREHEAVERCE